MKKYKLTKTEIESIKLNIKEYRSLEHGLAVLSRLAREEHTRMWDKLRKIHPGIGKYATLHYENTSKYYVTDFESEAELKAKETGHTWDKVPRKRKDPNRRTNIKDLK